MGLRDAKYSQQVDGLPGYIELAYTADGQAPAVVTVEVDGAHAIGDKDIAVQPLPEDVPMGAIIVFPNQTVIASEAAAKNATTLKVEAIDGLDGEGLKAALGDTDEGNWNGLYRDLRSQDLDFSRNPSVTRQGSIVHGPRAGSVTVQKPIVQSVAPTTNRSGEFWHPSEIVDQLEKYSDTNAIFWVRQVLPDSDGEDARVAEGPALITNTQFGQPADGVVSVSYTVQWAVDARFEPVGTGTP